MWKATKTLNRQIPSYVNIPKEGSKDFVADKGEISTINVNSTLTHKITKLSFEQNQLKGNLILGDYMPKISIKQIHLNNIVVENRDLTKAQRVNLELAYFYNSIYNSLSINDIYIFSNGNRNIYILYEITISDYDTFKYLNLFLNHPDVTKLWISEPSINYKSLLTPEAAEQYNFTKNSIFSIEYKSLIMDNTNNTYPLFNFKTKAELFTVKSIPFIATNELQDFCDFNGTIYRKIAASRDIDHKTYFINGKEVFFVL